MPPKPSPKPPGPGGKPGKRPPGKGKPGKGKPGKGKPRPGGKSPPPSSPTPDANRHSVLGNFFPTQASLPANRTTVSPYQAVQYGLGTPGQPHPLSVNTPPLLPDQMSALSPLTRGGGPAYGGGSMGAAPHSPPHHNQQISSPVMDRTPWSPVAQPPSTAMHPAMQPPHGSTIQPLSPQPSSPCAVTPLSPRPSSPTCMPLSPPPHMRSCQPLSQPMQHCYQQPPPQQHHQFMQHCGPPPNHCAPQQMQPQPQSPQNGCQPMQHCCPQPSVPHQQPRNATPPAAAQTPPSSPPSPLPPQPATAVQHARPMPSPPQQSGLLALLSQVVAPVSTFETLTVQHGQANKLKSEGEFMRDLRELEYDTAHKELIHRTQEQEAECARMEREIRIDDEYVIVEMEDCVARHTDETTISEGTTTTPQVPTPKGTGPKIHSPQVQQQQQEQHHHHRKHSEWRKARSEKSQRQGFEQLGHKIQQTSYFGLLKGACHYFKMMHPTAEKKKPSTKVNTFRPEVYKYKGLYKQSVYTPGPVATDYGFEMEGIYYGEVLITDEGHQQIQTEMEQQTEKTAPTFFSSDFDVANNWAQLQADISAATNTAFPLGSSNTRKAE